ncbi:MAG: type 4a pilus biogenesis protein PilO [Planctomycetota bacterium]
MAFEKHALLLVLGYAGTMAGAGAAGYYFYEEYKEARDQEANLKKQAELADIKINRVPSLETDVICLRENLSELVKILPTSKEVNEFVNKLNDFSMEASVQINALTPPSKNRSNGKKQKDVFDKVIYKLEMTANVEEFLAFLSLCEGWERFVRVTSMEVKSGDWDEDMSREDVVHNISVELETYAYQGGDDPSRSTTILNYDKRKNVLRDEIVSRRADIRVERYTLVPNPMRRDPFVDPRRRLTDDGDGGLPYPEQKILVEDMLTRADELKSLSTAGKAPGTNFIRRLELETEIDQKSQSLKEVLDQTLAARSITDHALKRRVEREVIPILKELLERDQTANAAATLDDLRRYLEDMVTLLDQGKYEAVLQKNEIIVDRVDPAALDKEGASLLHLIKKAATEAEVALDFAKKDFEIRGAIVADAGSVVVINGHVLQEGDALEDGLVIHHIASDRIEFVFRGVVLARAR